MASGGDLKGFYREKKRGGTSSSTKASKKSSTGPKARTACATLASNTAQPPALISHGSLDLKDDYDKKEEVLQQFDMDMCYGPCLGFSRLERWERAHKLGLNPPKDVESLLKGGVVAQECLWDGRI